MRFSGVMASRTASPSDASILHWRAAEAVQQCSSGIERSNSPASTASRQPMPRPVAAKSTELTRQDWKYLASEAKRVSPGWVSVAPGWLIVRATAASRKEALMDVARLRQKFCPRV
eukprot:5321903-Prymnesium_polylepis.1